MEQENLKKKIWIWFGLIVTTCLLYLCFRKIDFQKFWIGVEQANLFYLLLGVFFTLSILLLSATQFQFLLPKTKKVAFYRIFQIVSVFAMMVNLLPFWGGHTLFVYLLGHREKVGKTIVLSALTIEQIADGFAKLFIFGLVALIAPFPHSIAQGIKGVIALVLIAYLALFFLAIRYKNFSQEENPKEFLLWKKISHFFKNWAYHLHALRSFKGTSVAILLGIGMKGMEIGAVFMVQKAFGLDLPLSAACLVVAALCIATTLPLTPGRLGVFEGAVFFTYQYLGIDSTLSALLAVFTHIVHTVPFLLIGYLMSFKVGFKKEEMNLYLNDAAVAK